MTKKEKLDFCKNWIKNLDNQYSKLDDDREEALKFCNGDPDIVAIIKGRSEIVTNDMTDAIDMAKPDILESIAGVDDPLKLDPSSSEDVEPVKKLEILANIMVKRKNPWFRLCNDFLEDSMKLKFGAFKYQWYSKDKSFEKEYEDLTDVELEAKLAVPGAKLVSDSFGETEEKEDDSYEMEDNSVLEEQGRHTVIKYSLEDEFVKIDTIPSERLRFPLDSIDFSTAAFVVEEVTLYKHEFINLYGLKAFKKIEEEKEALKNMRTDLSSERYADVGRLEFIYDKESKKYRVFECYFPTDEDCIPWIFVFIGEQVLVDEKNKYGKPPYRGGSPFLLAHRLLGAGYFDYLREIQRQRTYFKRQIFDNCTQANFRRYFGDPERMNLDDYLNNNSTNALIRVQGDPKSIVLPEEKAPLPPEVLSFWEMLNIEKDMHIPTPRNYQGIDVPGQENSTYRGQKLRVDQSSKKLLMMIRGYMEDVFGPLFNDVIDCILKFMKTETSIRYLNEDYGITPDNIIGKYDLVVNVGLGVHDKLDQVAKLQQLIGLAFQALPTGCITSQNIHYMFSELVRAMGFLNTTDFVTDPKLKEMVMQLLEVVMSVPPLAEVAQPLAMQIMATLGVQPPQPGENSQGSFPGQNTAEQPALPMNKMEPRTTPDGGGFYA